tara:strand:+ start:25 stop:525 length:501 start_codon:yes stop_codon:yes gene_type:complete
MDRVGNFNNTLAPEINDLVMISTGQARPGDWEPINAVEEDLWKQGQETFNFDKVMWYVYEQQDLQIDLKFPWTTGNCHWWITKLLPGQMMPMHTDPHTHDDGTCKRYWVPLQDYIPGHVFIYNDVMVSDYKRGDVFQYSHSQDEHGAANLSFVPRIVLQVTEYTNH